MKVVDVAQMRAIEGACADRGLPGPALMEIAGRAIADAAWELFGPLDGHRVTVLAGPGNNGGDGLVAARWLAQRGAHVLVLIVGRRVNPDVKADLLADLGVALEAVDETWSPGAMRSALAGSTLIVDALLGIGQNRPIGGVMKALLGALAELGLPIVAVDVPSGLDADSGQADPATPRCQVTLTLGALKRGLTIGDGPDRAGHVVPLGIGIPSVVDASIALDVLDGRLLRSLLPARSVTGHKGSFGRVLIVGGSSRYLGAPLLAALGAARSGAGLVTLAAPAAATSAMTGQVPEITILPLPGPATHLTPGCLDVLAEGAAGYDAIVCGPGLGRHAETAEFLFALLADERVRAGRTWVLDADALTLLSREAQWWERLPPDAVLTPHAGEMARLVGTERIGPDRLRIAIDPARAWATTLVLKGAYSIVASPEGHAALSLAANPALGTAGTGDVLAGAIAGLAAQGRPPFSAARLGVGLHGAAGELARRARGPSGVLARDVAELLPRAADSIRRGDEPWGIAAVRALLTDPAW